ncbi:MAG: hypothetical protein ABL893_19425, partial [Hyphomicrobium sp.]
PQTYWLEYETDDSQELRSLTRCFASVKSGQDYCSMLRTMQKNVRAYINFSVPRTDFKQMSKSAVDEAELIWNSLRKG